jgi:hypothetical protein
MLSQDVLNVPFVGPLDLVVEWKVRMELTGNQDFQLAVGRINLDAPRTRN